MKLYVDLDLRQLVLTPGWTSPLGEIIARRGDVLPTEIQFVRDGAVIDAGNTTGGGAITIRATLKTFGEYSENPPLTITTSWTKSGATTTTKYSGLVDLTGAGVASLVGEAADGSAMLEVSWVIGTDVGTSRMVLFTIENSVYRGGDAVPTATPAQGSVIFLPAVTGLTGGGATNLDGVVTVGVTPPQVYVLAITTGGYLTQQTWALVAGTDDADGVTIIHPVDYNASTNAKVFKRIS